MHSNIFEPKTQYALDYRFASIPYEISKHEQCEEFSDGPIPETAQINYIPKNWYTQYWCNCAAWQLAADLDSYEFREICEYTFEDDETIYTDHPLDLY